MNTENIESPMNIAGAQRAWPVVENFLPDFELPSSGGKPVAPADFRNRRNLVLAFVGEYSSEHSPSSSHSLLLDLARHYAEIVQENAEVLAIVRGTTAQAAHLRERYDLPYPVLADEDGRAHRAYGAVTLDGRATSEAVYVAGRFGKVYLDSRATDTPSLPMWHGILGALRYIEAQCPECGQYEL